MNAIETHVIFNGMLGQPIFSPDGSIVYLPLAGVGYHLIDAGTRQRVTYSLIHGVGVPFATTADRRCAFSAGAAGAVVMIDLVTGDQLASIPLPLASAPEAVATDPDGRIVYVAGCPHGICRVDVAAGMVSTPLLSFSTLDRIAASADGRRAVITGSQAGIIDLPGGRFVRGLYDDSVYPTQTVGVAVRSDAAGAYVTQGIFPNLGPVTRHDLAASIDVPPLPLEVMGDAVALSPGDHTLYVVSSSGDRLYAVDGETTQVTASVAVPGTPVDIAVAPDGSSAYLARAAGDLVRIDLATLAVAAGIPFPAMSFDAAHTVVDAVRGKAYTRSRSDIRSFDFASGASATVASLPTSLTDIALSRDGETLYVAREQSYVEGWVDFIDIATGVQIAEVRFFDGAPEALRVTPDGSRIAVAVSPGFESDHGSLAVIDTGTGTATAFGIDLGRSYPSEVWVDAAGQRAYISGCRRGTCVVDLTTVRRLDDLAFGVSDLAFAPDGSRAYAAIGMIIDELDAAGQTMRSVTLAGNATRLLLSEDGTILFAALPDRVIALDTASLSVTDELAMNAPYGLSLAHLSGGRLLIVGSPGAGATILDPSGTSPGKIVPPTFAVRRLALSRDQRRAYVTGVGDVGYLWPVDLIAGRPLDPIEVGGDPGGVALSADGATVYVAEATRNALVTVDAATLRVGGSVPVGLAPRDVAVVSVPELTPSTATPSPSGPTPTATATRIRRTHTPTPTPRLTTPTRIQTPICGKVCDGRPCGYILCPDGFTFSQATCSDPAAGTCGCVPIGCATLTPTPTATLRPVPDAPCGAAPPLFRGEPCGAGGDACVTIDEDRFPLEGRLAAAAIDALDTLHLLFRTGDGAASRYATRAPAGEWRAEDFPERGFVGGLAVNRDGIPFTVTQSDRDNHQQLWERRDGLWSVVDRVPGRAWLDLGPLLIDDGGCLHAAGYVIAAPASIDAYVRWHEGWSFAEASSGGGELCTVALSPRGRPYLLARRFASSVVDLTLTAVPGVSESVPLTNVDVSGERTHLAITEDSSGDEIVHTLALVEHPLAMDGMLPFTPKLAYARRAVNGEWKVTDVDAGSSRAIDPCGEPPHSPYGPPCIDEYTTVRPIDILSNGSAVWLVFARQSFRAEYPLRCPAPRICDWDRSVAPTRTAAETLVVGALADGFQPTAAIPDVVAAFVALDRHGHFHVLSSEEDGNVHHIVLGGVSEPTDTATPTRTDEPTPTRTNTPTPTATGALPSASATAHAGSNSGGGCEVTPHDSASPLLSFGLMLLLIRRALAR